MQRRPLLIQSRAANRTLRLFASLTRLEVVLLRGGVLALPTTLLLLQREQHLLTGMLHLVACVRRCLGRIRGPEGVLEGGAEGVLGGEVAEHAHA